MTDSLAVTSTEAATSVAVGDRAALVGNQRRTARPPVRVIAAGTWLVVIVLAAMTADLLPIADPDVDVGAGVRTPPFTSWSEPLGTDPLGRSMLSRIIHGAQVSLAAGLGAVVLALAFGLLVGVCAGYFRGRIDAALGILLDSLLAIPALFLLLTLAATLQPGLRTVIVGLALVVFPQFARLARANTLQYASADFVMASRGLGAPARTILFREILPLVFRHLTAYAGVICAVLILAESSLSFLGLGVPQPRASWGSLIAEGRMFLQTHPYLVFTPVAVLFLTIFAMNTVGDWLRQRTDLASRL